MKVSRALLLIVASFHRVSRADFLVFVTIFEYGALASNLFALVGVMNLRKS